MTRTPSPRSPRGAPKLRAVPDTPDSPRAQRGDGWTRAKQVAFLRALSATHSVSEAARSVGMSRQSAYRLRSRLKGQPFDLAWEVAFHHSYDVLAHAALERALNGVEVPVFFQGEQVGSYRRFDERLTVHLLHRFAIGGTPMLGRLAPMAERHARDFEALLGKLERGEAVETGALTPEDPGEMEALRRRYGSAPDKGGYSCPSSWSDEELMAALQEHGWEGDA
ncbi:MAG: hypothetical protein GC147_03215 [Porphyrobacter sp.]|nr:hypothetical protein [Porphyrobacter sp.]